MGDVDRAVPCWYRAADQSIGPQYIPGNGDTDDVDDRIDRPDLMEVYFFDRGAMDLRFRFGKSAKNSLRQVALRGGETASVDHLGNVTQMTVRMFWFVTDVDFGRSKTIAEDFFGFEAAGVRKAQSGNARLNGLQRHAGVDQRPKHHVPANAACALQVGNLRHRNSSIDRWQCYRERDPGGRRTSIDVWALLALQAVFENRISTFAGRHFMERTTTNPQTDTAPQPWGALPPRMHVLFVTNEGQTGKWLAEAFAADSACQVILEAAIGIVNGLSRLRDEVFDVVLIAHQPDELNALEILDAVRTGASPEQPVIVLGGQSEAEMQAICFEAGADAYLAWDTTTTRSLMWQIARASERQRLLSENRELRQAKAHQRDVDEAESFRMLEIQRRLADGITAGTEAASMLLTSERTSGWQPPPRLIEHYREMLQAYVIMGAGNLSEESSRLTKVLITTGIGARQFMQIHLMAVETMVRDLGKRSARHVMNRADMLAIEVLLRLCEGFRECLVESVGSRRPACRTKAASDSFQPASTI